MAPDFHGEELPCYQQIIYSVPNSGIIYDGRNRLLACPTNRIAKIEIYVPEDLDVELPLDYRPIIYCNNLTMEPSMNQVIREGPNHSATLHNPISGIATTQNLGYKTYSFDGIKFTVDSQIRLELTRAGQIVKGKIKYSIIENKVVRLKNGYIGLAF